MGDHGNVMAPMGTDLVRRSGVAWYNFVWVNTVARMTPAMAAGLAGTILTMRDVLAALKRRTLWLTNKWLSSWKRSGTYRNSM